MTDPIPLRSGSRRQRGRLPRRGVLLRRLALGCGLLAVLGCVGGWGYVSYLDGNIRHGALSFGNQGSVRPDAAGDTPLNILLIGSDTRDTAADLRLGGSRSSVGGPAHADVEMLLHVSADRSNASLISIPRDTMVDIPACADPATGKAYPEAPHEQITDSLSHGGPGCTVYTWHQLTGIHIDHFMMVDFGGVVSMADAIGGVPVCVTANVTDPYSHLRLTRGDHVVRGEQALEWLRSRHGFGDGSDLYRTQVQHMYLTSMLRRLRSAGTLTDPGRILSLADAATRALTVDDGLDSVGALAALADQLKGITPDRLTTVTMPYAADPSNPKAWVIPMPGDAERLFAMVRGDVPLDSHGRAPAASAAPAPTGPPVPAVPPAGVRVTVQNGSGVPGRAGRLTGELRALGFALARNGLNAPELRRATTLAYDPADRAEAVAVAGVLHLPPDALRETAGLRRPTLVIGSDWPEGSVYPLVTTPSAGAVPTTAPVQSGDQARCAKVNPAYTW
ncbi:LCP family protein [Streptacidiphilus sp. P02-A3a]|uniref:LCP family protein n=1 Tax=Streptacidiphilus sp. P02-A3a TaxID=2704468 RepID=UPI0015FE353A|nr:LCP family protein [Streptacidiphilus sp. P02-A3a]QMU67848.1 LCP family protein [Streptacidiphilus sp. P02-A3a]